LILAARVSAHLSAPVIAGVMLERCVGFDVSIHLSEPLYCRYAITPLAVGLQIGSFRVCGNLIAAGDFNAHAFDAALQLSSTPLGVQKM
jgi:hypothetical protein